MLLLSSLLFSSFLVLSLLLLLLLLSILLLLLLSLLSLLFAELRGTVGGPSRFGGANTNLRALPPRHADYIGRTEAILAAATLADLRARAARVRWREFTGCTTKKMQPFFLVVLSSGCNPHTCTNTPMPPVRVDLPTWLLPRWFP